MNKILIFILAFSALNFARADGEIYLPNIPGYATGTKSGNNNALDVTLVGGGITIGAVSQGTPGPLASPWPVEGSDGTNHASYTAGNSQNVNLTGSTGTLDTNLTQIGGVSFALGQNTMANSLSCAMASDQTAVPVSGTFWQATQQI